MYDLELIACIVEKKRPDLAERGVVPRHEPEGKTPSSKGTYRLDTTKASKELGMKCESLTLVFAYASCSGSLQNEHELTCSHRSGHDDTGHCCLFRKAGLSGSFDMIALRPRSIMDMQACLVSDGIECMHCQSSGRGEWLARDRG